MSEDLPPPGSSPGWYRPTPQGATERWFDGTSWTALERQVDVASIDRGTVHRPGASDPPTVIVPPVAPIPPIGAPGPQHPPPHPDEQTVTRARLPTPPAVAASGPTRRTPAPVLVGIVVLALLAVVGIAAIVWAATRDDSSVATDTAGATDTTVPTSTDGPSPTGVQPTGSIEVLPSVATGVPPTAAPNPPPTVVGCSDPGSSYWPATTVGAPVSCPEYPMGSPGVPATTIVGPYILVLDSIEMTNPGRVTGDIADWKAMGVPAAFADSRSYLGLRDPYLVVFVDGISSAASGRQYCQDKRIAANRCYPRNPFDPYDTTTQPKQ